MAGLKSLSDARRSPARERLRRACIMLALCLVTFLPLHLVHSQRASSLMSLRQPEVRTKPFLASRERMLEITRDNRDLAYLPRADILLMTMAKGGSSSVWHWLYTGVTGRPKFNNTSCQTYAQDVRSHCWGGEAEHVFRLSVEDQWRVLTGSETLRVAIQRNPYERLVSSWKSKFTCDGEHYGTDLRNRVTMVPQLLRQAGLPENPKGCLTIEEFAEALDAVMRKVGTPGHRLQSLHRMDVHIRPQDFFFDEIDYDIVLDVKEMTNTSLLQPVINRLAYKDLVKNGPPRKHASKGSPLLIPEKSARILHMFALKSKIGPSKYMTTK